MLWNKQYSTCWNCCLDFCLKKNKIQCYDRVWQWRLLLQRSDKLKHCTLYFRHDYFTIQKICFYVQTYSKRSILFGSEFARVHGGNCSHNALNYDHAKSERRPTFISRFSDFSTSSAINMLVMQSKSQFSRLSFDCIKNTCAKQRRKYILFHFFFFIFHKFHSNYTEIKFLIEIIKLT